VCSQSADLVSRSQYWHPQIFLNFNPCANFQTLLYRYIPVAYMCAHCWPFTSQSAWQRRVKGSGLSGVRVYWTGPLSYWQRHIILCVVLVEAACYLGHLKNFLIDCLDWSIRLLRHYSGRWPSWLVRLWLRPGDTMRQQARKLQWLHSAWSECWLLRLTGYSKHVVMWWPWQGITKRRVITPLLSVSRCGVQHCKRPTPSSLMPRGLAALHVQLLSGIHSAHAFELGYLSWVSTI